MQSDILFVLEYYCLEDIRNLIDKMGYKNKYKEFLFYKGLDDTKDIARYFVKKYIETPKKNGNKYLVDYFKVENKEEYDDKWLDNVEVKMVKKKRKFNMYSDCNDEYEELEGSNCFYLFYLLLLINKILQRVKYIKLTGVHYL